MRLIGHVKIEGDAKVFGDYLTSVQIKNMIEPETDGSWSIWIHDEEKLAAGQEELAKFSANPADPKYRAAGKTAAVIQEKERKEQEEFNARSRTAQTMWPQYTLGLIGISVVVAVMAGLPPRGHISHWLWISDDMRFDNLPEVRRGEVWRLVTPIFLHMSFSHILFNMLALKFLGSMVESRLGSWKLLLMVLVIAVLSNVGQYYWDGPSFGGMSGVGYGLFGFIFMRRKCDPRSGLQLEQSYVVMMIAWFFFCLFGLMGPVANAAHGVGFAAGVAMGAWPVVGRLFGK